MDKKQKIRSKLVNLMVVLSGISIFLGACSKPSNATPTIDPVALQTQAVGTFAAGLTETAAAQPTETPSPTPSPSPTVTLTPTLTRTAAPVILPTSSCYVLSFISDVTIPDNTRMTPGQQFTKTWRVKNTGTCDWEEGFQVRFYSGNSLSGKTYTLGKTVEAGSQLDISVGMTAPAAIGTYTGNWRMTDGEGRFFGDSFYVMILVAEDSSPTSTAGSPTGTSSPTPEVTETSAP